MRGRAYVLNTRPVLNFIGVDRVELLPRLLGATVHVPPSVLRELREHIAWTARHLTRRVGLQRESVDPAELGYVENLKRLDTRLVAPHIRRMRTLELSELEWSAHYMGLDVLGAGESEVLAIAKHRGWVAVIDEFVGHCQAEADGIQNVGTLGVLVRGVKEGVISEGEAALLWASMQQWWDYAPTAPLSEYLLGRPLWRPCPSSSEPRSRATGMPP